MQISKAYPEGARALGPAQHWNYEHRKDIQGLRAIAVTSVVCFHAGLPVQGGFTGVDIFFVISGFVITLLLTRQYDRAGSINLWDFYFRRFKRLMPALALVVSVTIGAGIFFLSPIGMQTWVSASTGIGAILLCSNAVIAKYTGGYFNLAAESNPLLNLWSLSVEEQFYLFFPSLLFVAFRLMRRHRAGRHAPLTAVILLSGISLALALFASSGILMPGKLRLLLGFYSPVSRAWEFGAGAILALLRDKAPDNPAIVNGLAVGGATLLALSFLLISGSDAYPSLITFLPVLGTVALILAGSGRRYVGPVSRALAIRPLVRLGDISYSWYLWHWPIIAFTAKIFSHDVSVLVVAATLSLLPAIASYHWVENPLRRYVPTTRPLAARLMVRVLVPPLAVCTLYLFANSQGYWSPKIVAYQSEIAPLHASEATGCGAGFVPSPSSTACLWNSDATGTPIYLIGDSNADHLSEAVITAGRKLNSPVRIVTMGGCSLFGRSWSNQSDAVQAQCQHYVDSVTSFIRHSTPGIVIFGVSDSNWWIDGLRVGPSRDREMLDPKAIVRYLNHSLAERVSSIKAMGNVTVLVQPVPKYIKKDGSPLYDPDACTVLSILDDRCPQRVVVSLAFENSIQHDARDGILQAAHATGSALLDLRSQFCSQGYCTPIAKDGTALYRDAGHLSLRGGEMLAGVFYREFASLERPRKAGGNPADHTIAPRN